MIGSRLSRTLFAVVAGSATMLALLPSVAASAATAAGTPVLTGATVTPAVHQDVSAPLSALPGEPGDHQAQHLGRMPTINGSEVCS